MCADPLVRVTLPTDLLHFPILRLSTLPEIEPYTMNNESSLAQFGILMGLLLVVHVVAAAVIYWFHKPIALAVRDWLSPAAAQKKAGAAAATSA